MSTRTASIPDGLTEPVFVLGLLVGAALLGIGFGMFILGVSIGIRGGQVLTQSQQYVAMASGAVVALLGVLVRRWRGDASRGAIERAGVVVGGFWVLLGVAVVALGVAGLLELSAPEILETLKLSPRTLLQATWLAAATAVAGLVVAAVGALYVRNTDGMERADLELGVWAAGTLVVVAGLTALFIGFSSHEGVSAPFFETMRDKAVMVAFGQLLMLAGWSSIRVSGRTVGW